MVRGNEQKEGLDFKETFAPLIKWSTITNDGTLWVEKYCKWMSKQLFWTMISKKEVYMKQLEGFVKLGSEHLVYWINKTLYGLCQAPWAWYPKINKFFKSLWMIKCGIESNLYFWQNEGEFLIVMLYADDLVLIRNNDEKIAWFKR